MKYVPLFLLMLIGATYMPVSVKADAVHVQELSTEDDLADIDLNELDALFNSQELRTVMDEKRAEESWGDWWDRVSTGGWEVIKFTCAEYDKELTLSCMTASLVAARFDCKNSTVFFGMLAALSLYNMVSRVEQRLDAL